MTSMRTREFSSARASSSTRASSYTFAETVSAQNFSSAVSSPVAASPVKRRRACRPLRWYALADLIALPAGFLCAWVPVAAVNSAFLGRTLPLTGPFAGTLAAELLQFLAFSAGVILWFQHSDHYRMRMPFWLEMRKVAGTLGFAMLVDGFLQFASRQDFSRLWLISGWVFSAGLVIGLRALLRRWLQQRGTFQLPTLLVGSGETAMATRAALVSEPSMGYAVTAQVKDLPSAFLQAGRSWKTLCAQHGAEHVIIALDGKDLAAADQPLAQLMRETVPFSMTPPLRHLPVLGMMPQYFFHHDVLLMTRTSGLEQSLPRFLKRAVDVLASGGALLVLSPFLLLLAVLVKSDGGPALFGHPRLGRNGRVFSCLKFRSMVTNGDEVLQRHLASHPEAQEMWGDVRKLTNDPRITRIGAFLRKTSLDELPQLVNVLRGEMSIVGPRPIVAAEVPKYDRDIAHYYRVCPGITGLWQVSGRNDVSYSQRVAMDSWYVRNWSLWNDIAILCKTFPAVLNRSGAY